MSLDNASSAPPRGYVAWVAGLRNHQRYLRLLSRLLAPLGLSVAQHEVLQAIGRGEGLTQQELAQSLQVVKSNISGLLQRLEKQRLVSREPNPADARSKHLLLTDKGHRVLRRSSALQARVVETMMSALDDHDLELSHEFNRRVGAVLDQRLRGLQDGG